MTVCQIEERDAGRVYPRTCPTCKLSGACAKNLDRKSLLARVEAAEARAKDAEEALKYIGADFPKLPRGLTDFGERQHYLHLACRLRDRARAALTEKGQDDAVEALRTPAKGDVAEALTLKGIEPGDGFWRSCSGCHETVDGAETGWYSYSATFQCVLGGGCTECGGLGAVWDNTDYEELARAIIAQQEATPPRAT